MPIHGKSNSGISLLLRMFALGLVASSLLLNSSPGQTQRNWIGPVGGDWFTAGNWTPNGTPLSSDFLTLSSGDEPDSGGATIQISFGGFLDISDTANATTGAMIVGSNGLGTLAMSGGALTSNTATIGNVDNAIGIANINGLSATWNAGGDFTVGNLGHGTLNITSGAEVISTGSGSVGNFFSGTGIVNISGSGSLWEMATGLTVGSSGNGTVNIVNDATVENTSSTIGSGTGSVGRVSVDSRGVWTNSLSLTVAGNGLGELEIRGGGQVTATTVTVGNSSNGVGRVTVDGPDSLMGTVGSVIIGATGFGELEIAHGARVENLGGIVGSEGGTGQVVVRHGGTWSNSGGLNIGMSGEGNLTVELGGILESAAGTIGTNVNGVGTVTIDGMNSTWTNTGMLQVGVFGTGTLDIVNGGVVSNDYVEIGSLQDSQGTVNIIGVGSEWNNGDDLIIGGGGNGEMNVLDGAAVTSLTGLIATGSGTTGIVNIRGTDSRWAMTSDLNVGTNAGSVGDLSIAAGGEVSAHNVVIGNSGSATGTVTVSGLNSELTVHNVLTVGAGLSTAAMTIEDQATVVTAGTIVGDNGALTIDNATLTTVGLNATNGQLDFTAGVVTINGGAFNPPAASFTLDSTSLATMNLNGTSDGSDTLIVGDAGTAVMNYSDGSTHTNGSGTTLGKQAGSSGTLNLTGAGTQFKPSDYLYVGESGVGTVTITAGAVADSDLIVLGLNAGASGVVNVSGSKSTFGTETDDIIVGDAGRGELHLTDQATGNFNNMQIGANAPGLQSAVTVADNATLYVTGTLDMDRSSVLRIDGGFVNVINAPTTLSGNSTIELQDGTLRVEELTATDLGSHLEFRGGTLIVESLLDLNNTLSVPTGGSLMLQGDIVSSVASQPGSTITIDSPATTMGDANNTNSINLQGSLNVGAHTLTLNSFFNPARLGEVTSLEGGQIIAPAGISLGDGDVLSGGFGSTSVVAGRVAAGVGSFIAGALTLGDNTQFDGFVSDGMLLTFNATVTLHDANEAVLGSLTQLGHELLPGQAGTLVAANGAVLDFGRNVVGYGTLDTPNDPFKPFINNGHIEGNSLAEPVTLNGYVKGVGTMNNVVITGTNAPGFSPATVNYGSVEYQGTLEIELAGLLAGSFDKIIHSGVAELGGVLDVSLINGFVPTAGNTFEIITAAGGVNGTFASELLPSLGAGLDWDVTYGANNVVLSVVTAGLPGDFDFDGDVDGRDFLVWQRGGSPNPLSAGDLADWQAGYGVPSPLLGSVGVPEPASVFLLTLVVVMDYRRRVR